MIALADAAALPTDAQLDPGGNGQGRWAPDLVWRAALTLAQLEYRMVIVWEQFGKDAPCSWGSWLSPNAPNVRGRHEVIFFRCPNCHESVEASVSPYYALYCASRGSEAACDYVSTVEPHGSDLLDM